MSDIIDQRNIGKQLMLVNILRRENEKAQELGLSYIDKDDIVSWSMVSKEEVSDFVSTFTSLDKKILAANAANEFKYNSITPLNPNLFSFLFFTYKNIGEDLFKCCSYSTNSLIEYGDHHAKENYQRYVKDIGSELGEVLGTPSGYLAVIRSYLQFFVRTVNSILKKGYEWDVVSEMLWCDIDRDDYIKLSDQYSVEN